MPPAYRIEMGSSPHINKRKNPSGWMGFFYGGDWGTRTLDLMRVKHAL